MIKKSTLINFWRGDLLLENLANGSMTFDKKIFMLLVPLLTMLISRFTGLKLISEGNASLLKIILTTLNVFLVLTVINLYRFRQNRNFIEEFILLTVPAAIRSYAIIFFPLLFLSILIILSSHYLGEDQLKSKAVSLFYFIIVPQRIYYCYYIVKCIYCSRRNNDF